MIFWGAAASPVLRQAALAIVSLTSFYPLLLLFLTSIHLNSRSVSQHSLHLPGLKVKHKSDLGWERTAQRRAGFYFALWGQEPRIRHSPAQASAFSWQRLSFMEAPCSPHPALPWCLVRKKRFLDTLLLGSLLSQTSI